MNNIYSINLENWKEQRAKLLDLNKLEKRKGISLLPFPSPQDSLRASIRTEIDFYKTNFHLSQEEIDQIMKELKEEQQLGFPYFGTLQESPKLEPNDLKYTPMEKKKCEHDWQTYVGLQQSDTYCTKCNEIKK